MHQLRLVENQPHQVLWRETDFADDIPATAMAALAAYYPLARCPDRSVVEQWIAAEPSLFGPQFAMFQTVEDGVELVMHGKDVCSKIVETLIHIIERDVLGTEDGARRYEIETEERRDATLLPLFQNAGLCLAVVI
ncbi:hypothetical protein NUH88_15110 [Nisaea acidiphila]|uniref:Uncharacterized protein n=1 Tax=Nisaea acidiphila TaxID=1862145 RepID=A0A9J7AM62_9PROT|nr:hypothetical protein [Nisaea acidiphila]UUX48731.1 hypothetical protein NUH88_15110 [Nisaea acidiphila]